MKPPIPIHDKRFQWIAPAVDTAEAFRQRMRKRMEEAKHAAAMERAGIVNIKRAAK